MTRPLLASAPAAGFEQPFEMLATCHERVERMLALLERLRAHVAAHGVDAQARQAARDVLRYFDQAAPQHHRDEELHVFPPLLAQGDARTVAIVRQLQAEHRLMESNWAAARAVLQRLAEEPRPALHAADHALLESFVGLHGWHLAAEDQVAYPAARGLLDSEATAAMGQEMMRRRGVR